MIIRKERLRYLGYTSAAVPGFGVQPAGGAGRGEEPRGRHSVLLPQSEK